ncbi:pentapeptide repeat-containing protein [Sinorhizobium psoraleae]|uniref:pentapeptide repeat-containing protein n=1 Tax=Sinorhizobium psoraleae TaxID=520838 RepID=UPI00156A1595|nr:pentapeptide repeat-containing protein [Sinorhizobium psoraleae]
MGDEILNCFDDGTANVATVHRASTSVFPALFGAVLALAWADPAAAEHCKNSPAPGLDWSECRKSRLMLSEADLESANLFKTNFTLTDLRRANLKSANLEKAKLVRASLVGASAEKANFAQVEAHRANFAGISAKGASFVNAELQRADFSQARLTDANFEKAELGRATFHGAKLKGTRFSRANLSRADFSGAYIEGAIALDGSILFLTRIEGVDLSAATGLQQAQVDQTCGDAATKLPPGLAVPARWPCEFD